ncbi:MAG: hypothetical protein JXR19_06150 [Bacteroidia bacterium]
MLLRYTYLILILFSCLAGKGQTNYALLGDGSVQVYTYEDQSSLKYFLDQWLLEKRSQSYLTASIDSQHLKGDTLWIYTYTGKAYQKLYIQSHNIPYEILDSQTKSLSIAEFSKLNNQILTSYENMGYPFAHISLKNYFTQQDGINAEIFFNPGIFIKYDSLEIVGDSKLSKRYLSQYLGLIKGEPYSEEAVSDIDKKLRNLSLVRVRSKSKIYFYQGLAKIILFIDDQVTDRFDGIIGLAPNSQNKESNDLLITGEINVELNNLFSSAKQFEIHWKNYLQRSQLLNTSFTWPYLFQTKLGVNGAFNLNKYDTLFVNLESKLGFRYQKTANNYVQLYYKYNGSNLITTDTSQIRSSGKLPSNNPYRIDNYGLSLHQSSFDYLPNPRKGFSILADGSIGLKELLRNGLIDQVLFYDPDQNANISIYDTLDGKSIRARFEFNGKLYIPVFKRATVVQHLSFMGTFADQILFNEYYNFGGFGDLQGFDEKSLFASKYLMYRVEYKYLFSDAGNVGLFFNLAAMEDFIEEDGIKDMPYGFGVSGRIEVGGGILSLSYALGSQQNNPIAFNAAKIHFGIVNYF